MKKVISFFSAVCILAFAAHIHAASPSNVVINEIAWMGSTNSANDEWIELFNTTENQLDFSGWTLKTADEKIKINLQGQIPAKGFYLLERTDDNSVPGIAADLIYKGALSNNGQDLKLYDNLSNVIDEANYPTKWPAGDNTTKQTMERAALTNWQTSSSPNGTPKAQNSSVTIESPQLKETINPAPEPATSTVQNYPEGIIINEILPAPEGADETNEWIELYNTNNIDVDLANWKVQDTEGITTTYVFQKGISIAGNGYLVLKRPETKIILNNDQDGLNLLLPDEKIIDSVVYTSSPRNQSYNKTQTGWQWSATLTPGAKNIIAVPSIKQTIKKEIVAALPKAKKPDNSIINKNLLADVVDANSSPSGELTQQTNPWFLFFIAAGITIISGIAVLVLKLHPVKYLHG